MKNVKIIPQGFSMSLGLVLLAGLVGGLGLQWSGVMPRSLQLSCAGEWLSVAWEAAVVEEILFRGILLGAFLSWADNRHQGIGTSIQDPGKSTVAVATGGSCGVSNRSAKSLCSGRSYTKTMPDDDPCMSGYRPIKNLCDKSVVFAVGVSSLVFGLMHLVPEGPLLAPGADLATALAQGVLKVIQSTFFGLIMALLVVRSPYARDPFPYCALALIAPTVVHGVFDMLYFGPLMLTGGSLPATYLTGSVSEVLPSLVMTAILLAAILVCVNGQKRLRKPAADKNF